MFKRFTLYTLLLAIVPFFSWIFQWHWQGDLQLNALDPFLFAITEMGSTPFAIVTCALFLFLILSFVTKVHWKAVIIMCVLSVLATQGVKSGLKLFFAEPRPYVVAMTQEIQSSPEQFYQQSSAERKQIVADFYAQKAETPTWLKQHRANEVGYSFPSGHSIFAATWLLLFVGFSSIFKLSTPLKIAVQATVSIWALLMLVSRLRLGMHYPIDLLVSIGLAWLINVGLFYFVEKRHAQFGSKEI